MAAQQGGAQQARRGAPQAHAAAISVAGDQRFGGARAQDGQVGQPLAIQKTSFTAGNEHKACTD